MPIFRQKEEGQRVLPASAVSQLLLACNNQYAKIGYFAVVCSDPLSTLNGILVEQGLCSRQSVKFTETLN